LDEFQEEVHLLIEDAIARLLDQLSGNKAEIVTGQ